jgi:ubiquitin-protein ligase
MNSLATKRIMNDLKILRKSNLEKENIYVSTNDDDIYNLKALIIGPPTEDAPYQGGFYFFDITYPRNYPLSPPTVIFCTLGKYKEVRFNPNLYSGGKVCLSLLGTWSGPGWTSSHSIKDVLIVLQSLLHEHPIQNEPGWENETGQKSKNYNIVLAHYNIKVATIQMIRETPPTFEVFKDIMISQLVKNIESYRKFIQSYEKYDGKKIKSGLYSMIVDMNSNLLLEDIMLLYSEYESVYLEK